MLIKNNKLLLAFGVRPADLLLNRQGIISHYQKIRLWEAYHKYQRTKMELLVMLMVIVLFLNVTVYTRGALNELNAFGYALGAINVFAIFSCAEQLLWTRKNHAHIQNSVVETARGQLHKHNNPLHHYVVINHKQFVCLDDKAFQSLTDHDYYLIYSVGRWVISAAHLEAQTGQDTKHT